MSQTLTLTDKIDNKLEEITKHYGVKKEGLGNLLLMMALCDEAQVKKIVNMIVSWGIGGVVDLENKGL